MEAAQAARRPGSPDRAYYDQAAERLGGNRAYMDDLEHEISCCRGAYVGAAVTEIAVLRGVLSGPLSG